MRVMPKATAGVGDLIWAATMAGQGDHPLLTGPVAGHP